LSKRVRAVGGLVVLGVLACVSSAVAGMADRIGATFGLMSEHFIQAFNPLEGLVVGVDGGSLYLDLGERGGAQGGQEFTIFRKGDEFRHPLTRKVLGRYEEVLGYAQIRSVQPRFSEAAYVPIEGKPIPQPDDGVRITRGRIKAAITPVLDLTQSATRPDLRRVPYLLAIALEVADALAAAHQRGGGSIREAEREARPFIAVVDHGGLA